jgi:hypothetical protein
MFKTKLALFLAIATLSASASAGFVKYTFSGTTFSDGGALNGYFVQNTDDHAIAYFSLDVAGGALGGAQFFPSGLMSNVSSATTYFTGAGPTNFSAFNDQDVVYYFLNVQFGETNTAGTYRVFGTNDQNSQMAGIESGNRTIVGGFAVEGEVSIALLNYLEQGPVPEMNYIVPRLVTNPNPVPEPATLALMLLGAAGVVGARRRQAKPFNSSSVNPA